MNKNELVERVADATGEAKSRAGQFVDAVFDAVQSALAQGEKVSLPGFGTFTARERKARTGRNPQTGAAVKIPATTIPAFKAGQAFKDLVSGRAKLTLTKTAGKSKSSSRGASTSKTRSSAKPKTTAKKTSAKKTSAKRPAAKKSTAKRR